jgi:U3 small nucleolar RNA-associated protein 18
MVSASSSKKDALKLVSGSLLVGSCRAAADFPQYHLPSGTAFANWPTSSTPLGRVNVANFSPNGEYLSVGNTKGAVLLWSLKHYAH